MPILRLLIGLSGLVMLGTCKPAPMLMGPSHPLSLPGHYQVLTLTEKPYTDDSINDLVLFDSSTWGCDKQPVILSFATNGILTTGISPGCVPYTTWLAASGLTNASQWVVSGSTLVVTPTQGSNNSFAVQLVDSQLELSWMGADSSFVSLDGQLVRYSLALKRL